MCVRMANRFGKHGNPIALPVTRQCHDTRQRVDCATFLMGTLSNPVVSRPALALCFGSVFPVTRRRTFSVGNAYRQWHDTTQPPVLAAFVTDIASNPVL